MALQALWVLGSAGTLQRSPVWAALLEDAQKRHKIIPDALARCAHSLPCARPYGQA
jgi:hypothetical protein